MITAKNPMIRSVEKINALYVRDSFKKIEIEGLS